MKKEEIIEIFIRFLKHRNIYIPFTCAVCKYHNITLTRYLKSRTPEFFINDSFIWKKNIYDERLWSIINDQWQDILKLKRLI